MRSLTFASVIMSLALPVLAADGRREINQACAVNTGCFSGDTLGFPVTITGSAGESYVLTGDLQVPDENTSAIQVHVDSITVDLAGFEIRGVTTCSGVPIACSPTGSGDGVRVISVSFTEGLHVMNGAVTGMGDLGVSIGPGGVVDGVRATQNGRSGIGGHDSATLRNNIADSNLEIGMSGGAGSTITGNSASQNGTVGISAFNGSLVRGNTSYQNEDDGIRGGGRGITIIDNTSYDNGVAADDDGIQCSFGCTVRGNTVRNNSGFGIRLDNDSAYRENVVTNNTTGGITGAGSANSRGDNYCAGTGVASAFCP